MSRCIPAVALLLVGCSAHALDREMAQRSMPTPELIKAVETGLRGPVEVAGEGPSLMSLADRMAFSKVPGVSIAVIERGAIAWTRGYGLAYGQRPVTPDTLFQSGSISKPVTAVAAMREVEAGRLDLDADVNALLRSWQIPPSPLSAAHPVTLRRLLSHSAGLTVHGFPGYEPGQPLPTLLQILQGQPPSNTGPVRVEAQPGSEWQYSGGGYQVVQQILIDRWGKEFPAMVRERLFRPLAMARSQFEQFAPGSSAVDVATGHDREGREISGRWRLFPEMAAAGMWSTPTDLARFVIALQRASQGIRGSVVAATTAREIFTRQSGAWGLGFQLEGVGTSRRFRHGGDTPGYKAVLVAYPETGQGAVIMTNGDRGYRLIDEILQSIAAAYRWPDYGPKLKTPIRVDAAALDRVEGIYRLDALPDVRLILARRSEGLWLRIVQPAGENESELLPTSPDRFFRRDIDFELLFGPGNPAPKVTLYQDGQTFSATRVQEPSR